MVYRGYLDIQDTTIRKKEQKVKWCCLWCELERKSGAGIIAFCYNLFEYFDLFKPRAGFILLNNKSVKDTNFLTDQ